MKSFYHCNSIQGQFCKRRKIGKANVAGKEKVFYVLYYAYVLDSMFFVLGSMHMKKGKYEYTYI